MPQVINNPPIRYSTLVELSLRSEGNPKGEPLSIFCEELTKTTKSSIWIFEKAKFLHEYGALLFRRECRMRVYSAFNVMRFLNDICFFGFFYA